MTTNPSEHTQPAADTGVPAAMTESEREEFLAQPHIGILSVTGDDGRPPFAVPTWYAYQPGGNIAIVTRAGKRKSRLIAAAGQATFVVQRAELPYSYVTVEGVTTPGRTPTRDELISIGGRYLAADLVEGWADWEVSGGNTIAGPEYVEIQPRRWNARKFPSRPPRD